MGAQDGMQELPDQFSKAIGFQVEITGAAGAGETDGSWKAVRGGGIRFAENSGVTMGQDKYAQNSLGMREWEDVTIIGPVTKSRKDMLTWYLDTVKGDDWRRNISIIVLNYDGSELYRYNYMDCFLTAYSLTPLDAESEVECEETIEMCVGYCENYFKK
jgi:phage tail-like protein